jgi:hypothetical protein
MEIPSHLLPTSLERGFGGYALSHWVYRSPAGVTADHIMDPNLWVHVASRLRVDDKIEVIASDGSIDAELRVIAIDPRQLWAKMRPLRLHEASPVEKRQAGPSADGGGYIIEQDPVHGWRIVQGRELIAKDFETEDDARAALANLKAAASPKKKAA